MTTPMRRFLYMSFQVYKCAILDILPNAVDDAAQLYRRNPHLWIWPRHGLSADTPAIVFSSKTKFRSFKPNEMKDAPAEQDMIKSASPATTAPKPSTRDAS